MIFISSLTATAVQAQTATSFSGDATGVIANATIGNATVGTRVTTNATIAPTGPLPSAGGRRTNQVLQGDAAATIGLGILGSNNTLSTGLVTTRTSGGADGIVDGGTENSSQSQAVVNNLNLNIGAVVDPLTGGSIVTGLSTTADTITANTQCACGSVCSGTSVIEDLRVNGLLVGSEIPFVVVSGSVTVQTDVNGNVFLAATPNSQITVTVSGGTVTLFLNQQTSTGVGDITVNALRIQANLVGVTTDIIVSQSHSDIVCSLGPTAATTSISGRVVNSKQRGEFNVIVTLADTSGEQRSVKPNSFGYFRFDDVAVGETYIVGVRSKRQIFTPQVISVNDALTDLIFVPEP
jgi:hypothetical protein